MLLNIQRCVWGLLTAGLVLAGRAAVAADDDFVPPNKAEREAVAALIERGATVQIDAQYRVAYVVMPRNCSNDDLKLLAACQDLTRLQLISDQITDAGVEHLKGLKQLSSILLASSAMSPEEINVWRAALPNCQISTAGGARPPSGFVGGPGGPGAPQITAGRSARGTAPSGFGPGGPATAGRGPATFGTTSTTSRPLPLRTLAAQLAVQDDLKLTPEQRIQIAAATDTNAFMQSMEEKVLAVLSAEQKVRMKQIELQQMPVAAALVRDDIAKKLMLTDDQVGAIRNLFAEFAADRRTALDTLFRGGGSVRGSDITAKEAELATARDQKALALLNPEQLKAWQEMSGPPGPKVNSATTGSFGGVTLGGPSGPTFPTAEEMSKTLFQRYDADGNGTLTETELPASLKSRLTEAGATLKFPLSSEEFVKAHVGYLERNLRRRP